MRIRKNAKTSKLFHNFEPTFCLLNQSPWDIITFPSSPSSHQSDDFVSHYNVNVITNWSSPVSGTPIHSSISTKNSSDVVNENVDDDDEIKNYELGFMCDDNEVGSQNDAVWGDKKKAQLVCKSRGTKKRAVGIASKQNEFYFYSGFGPTWAKKRGLGGKCTSVDAYDTTGFVSTTTSSDVGDMDVEEDKCVELDSAMMKAVWSCQVVPKKDDSDYVEVEEVGDWKAEEKTMMKRGKKFIKARSLKSLM